MSTGGCFQEVLSKKRHLLITDLPAKGEKFNFAIQNNLPVVTVGWLQECLKQSKRVPFTEFFVEEQKGTSSEISVPLEDPGSSKRTGDAGDLGYNKRPRLSGIKQGGKLLGENLQSFGDRLRRRIPDEKTGADADAKILGPPSKNRDTGGFGGGIRGDRMGESLSAQTLEENRRMGLLDGCVVCVSRQLKVHDFHPTSCYEFRLTSLKHSLVALN